MNKKNQAVLMMAVVVLFAFLSTGCGRYVEPKENIYEELSEETLLQINQTDGYIFGSPNAPITVIEYSSYECKDCADLHANIGKTLRNSIDRGEIRYVFKPVDHPKFENDLEINLRLVPNDFTDLEHTFDLFDSYAHQDITVVERTLGLSAEQSEHAKEINVRIESELNSLDVKKTPTLIIGKRKYSEVVFTRSEFESVLQELKE